MCGQGGVVVLAREGRAAIRQGRRARQILRQHRRVERGFADEHRRERAALAKNLLRQQFTHIRHDGERQPQRDALLEPFHRRAMHQHRLDDAVQLFGMQIALGSSGVARVGAQFGQPDQVAERHPLRRRHHGDAEPAILGGEISDRKAAAKTVDADPRPGKSGLQCQRGIEFADLQHRLKCIDRKAPRALAVAREKSGQRRDERGEARDHADLAVAWQHRRPLNRADQFDQSCEAAAHRVGDCIIAVGAVFAEPGYRRDGEPGLRSPEIFVRQRRCPHDARRPRVEQQVGVGQQRANFFDARRLAEIGRDAALVGIEPGEISAFAVAVAGIDQRRSYSRCVAARGLDLDDIGTEISEQLAAIAERVAGANFHDAQFRQWLLWHFALPFDGAHLVQARRCVKSSGLVIRTWDQLLAAARGVDLPSAAAIAEISGRMKKASSAG